MNYIITFEGREMRFVSYLTSSELKKVTEFCLRFTSFQISRGRIRFAEMSYAEYHEVLGFFLLNNLV